MANKKLTGTFDRQMIAKIIAGVAVLLCFIGLFGTLMTSHAVGQGKSFLVYTYDLNFLFKEGWNKFSYHFVEVCNISKFALTLTIISFFIGALGILFAVGKAVYTLVKKNDINLKFDLGIALVSAVQYIFMARFTLGYDGMANKFESGTSNMTYLMGWGAILITIGFFLGIIALFIYDFDNKESIINKKSICHRIATIVIFFVGLYALTNMVSIAYTAQGSKLTSIDNYNAFSWLGYINYLGVEAKNYGISKALTIIAIILGIASFISLLIIAFYMIKADDNETDIKIKKISTIVFAATSLASNICMNISGYLFCNQDEEAGTFAINPGFTAIVSLVLGIGLIILVSIAYKEKKIKAK